MENAGKLICLAVCIFCTWPAATCSAQGRGGATPDLPYDLAFSTYIGGSKYEHIRDVCADADGNIYITGGTVTTTITTVKAQPIPDAMFEVPEGYKVIPMPTR